MFIHDSTYKIVIFFQSDFYPVGPGGLVVVCSDDDVERRPGNERDVTRIWTTYTGLGMGDTTKAQIVPIWSLLSMITCRFLPTFAAVAMFNELI